MRVNRSPSPPVLCSDGSGGLPQPGCPFAWLANKMNTLKSKNRKETCLLLLLGAARLTLAQNLV